MLICICPFKDSLETDNVSSKNIIYPQVLILAPTREIACQICSAIKSVASSYRNFDCEFFIGGRMVSSDIERIQGCQVVVGTPGQSIYNFFLLKFFKIK